MKKIAQLLLILILSPFYAFAVQYGSAITSSLGGASNPVVSVSAAFSVAAWQQLVGSNTVIQASVYFNSSWMSALTLSTTANGGVNASNPVIAANSNGFTLALWQQTQSSGGTLIQSSAYSAGGWSATPLNVSSAGQTASNPEIAVNDNNFGVAVWQQVNGSGSIIVAATYSVFTATWGSPTTISATTYNAINPQVKLNDSNTATAVWQQQSTTGGGFNVVASTYSGGTWSTPVNVTAAQ